MGGLSMIQTRAQAMAILANPLSSYFQKQQAIALLAGIGFSR